MIVTFEEYERCAMETKFEDLDEQSILFHAVFGLASEAGEVAGVLQKSYQGHLFDKESIVKELGDCLWMIAEACDVLGVSMAEVAQVNVDKRRARYPHGFSADRSLHRREDDK